MSQETPADLLSKILSDENMPYLNSILEKLPLIDSILKTLNELKLNGTMDSLSGMLLLLGNLDRVLDEHMINGIGSMANSALDIVSSARENDVENLISSVLEGVREGYETSPEIHGITGLYRKMRDPDIARGIQVLMSVLRAMGRTKIN